MVSATTSVKKYLWKTKNFDKLIYKKKEKSKESLKRKIFISMFNKKYLSKYIYLLIAY